MCAIAFSVIIDLWQHKIKMAVLFAFVALQLLLGCLTLDGASSAGSRQSSAAAAGKKNVLVMFIDDGGFQMGVYGNKAVKTPNIDNFAKRSVLFKHGFTSVSSCSPSRSALLTGLPQHQNGMYGLHHAMHHFQSFDGVHSLPLILNNTGGDYWYGIIGKKHFGPDYVYPFPFSYTEDDGYNLNQVGRNITLMNELVRKFFSEAQQKDKPFFLYVAFFDVHRGCGATFCEHFGDGTGTNNVIPDWTPIDYKPEDVEVPPYLPDTPATRMDISAQYRAVSRMDQGVGLFLKALKDFGYDNNTLVILTADNGIPFPNAKTNLYESGMGEPMIISNPMVPERWGQETEALASTTDIVPTILDWFDLKYPKYSLFGPTVTLQGKSLLPVLNAEPSSGYDTAFSSHNFHEVTMYYPMRVVRDKSHRLIHNLNFKMPYPIASDLFGSPTFQDILNHTSQNASTKWFKTLEQYYYRDEFELFDLDKDPLETKNVIDDPAYKDIANDLKEKLRQWQVSTDDPWLCMPEGEKVGKDKCSPFLNGL